MLEQLACIYFNTYYTLFQQSLYGIENCTNLESILETSKYYWLLVNQGCTLEDVLTCTIEQFIEDNNSTPNCDNEQVLDCTLFDICQIPDTVCSDITLTITQN